MKLFWAYLRQQRWVLLAYLLCGGIFAVTFALYRLPLAAVLYPAALGLVLLGGGCGGGLWPRAPGARPAAGGAYHGGGHAGGAFAGAERGGC